MTCGLSFCMVRKAISYFFRFLITVLVTDTFYRLKKLSESSEHFRSLWSAGVKSKHSFYLANSGVTPILFFFLSSCFAIFSLKICRCKRQPFPQPFFTQLTYTWDLICQAGLCSFWLGLFALQLSWFTLSCPASSLLVPCTVCKNKRRAVLWSISLVLHVFFFHFSTFLLVCLAYPQLLIFLGMTL